MRNKQTSKMKTSVSAQNSPPSSGEVKGSNNKNGDQFRPFEKELEEINKLLTTNGEKLKKKPELSSENELKLLVRKLQLMLKLKQWKEVTEEGYRILGKKGPNVHIYKCILVSLCRLGKIEDDVVELLDHWKRTTPKCSQMQETKQKMDGFLTAIRSGMNANLLLQNIEDILGLGGTAQTKLNSNFLTEPNWKFRAPPPRHNTFSQCPRRADGATCIYGDHCLFAHSKEELREWQLRQQWSTKKDDDPNLTLELLNNCLKSEALKVSMANSNAPSVVKEKIPVLYRQLPPACMYYLVGLMKKLREAEDVKTVLVDNLPEVKIKYTNPLEVRKTVTAGGSSSCSFKWTFMIAARQPLATVTLLHDLGRDYFTITSAFYFNAKRQSMDLVDMHPNNKSQKGIQVLNCFIRPDVFLPFNNGWPDWCCYQVDVLFQYPQPLLPNEPVAAAIYEQNIIFDFKSDPKVSKRLSVALDPKVPASAQSLPNSSNTTNCWNIVSDSSTASSSSSRNTLGTRTINSSPDASVSNSDQQTVENVVEAAADTNLNLDRSNNNISSSHSSDNPSHNPNPNPNPNPPPDNLTMGIVKASYESRESDVSDFKVLHRNANAATNILLGNCVDSETEEKILNSVRNQSYSQLQQTIKAMTSKFNPTSDTVSNAVNTLKNGDGRAGGYSAVGKRQQLQKEASLNINCNSCITGSQLQDRNWTENSDLASYSVGAEVVELTKDNYVSLMQDKAMEELALMESANAKFNIWMQADTRHLELVGAILRNALRDHHYRLLFPDLPQVKPWDLNSFITPIKRFEIHKFYLTVKQWEVVDSIISIGRSLEWSPPIIMTGPPFSGKSYILACAAISLTTNLLDHNEYRNDRVLICTYNTEAADKYFEEFFDNWITKHLCISKKPVTKALRLYKGHTLCHSVSRTVKKYCLLDEIGKSFRRPTIGDVLSSRIVVGTPETCAQLIQLGLPKDAFSYIFIDDAERMSEIDSICAISLAGRNSKLLISGDINLLGPETFCLDKSWKVRYLSLLERLNISYPSRHHCRFLLHETFKNNKDIVQFISKEFYCSSLLSVQSSTAHPEFYPLSFYAVIGGEELQPDHGEGFYNMKEIITISDRIFEVISSWPQDWGTPDNHSIAVITSYADQATALRIKLKLDGLTYIDIETLPNTLTKQYRVVFVSTVRTFRKDTSSLSTALNMREEFTDCGFLTNRKAINAAITRAKSLVMVVGDLVSLCNVGPCRDVWREYVSVCKRNNSLLGLPEHADSAKQYKQSLQSMPGSSRWSPAAVSYNIPTFPLTSGSGFDPRAPGGPTVRTAAVGTRLPLKPTVVASVPAARGAKPDFLDLILSEDTSGIEKIKLKEELCPTAESFCPKAMKLGSDSGSTSGPTLSSIWSSEERLDFKGSDWNNQEKSSNAGSGWNGFRLSSFGLNSLADPQSIWGSDTPIIQPNSKPESSSSSSSYSSPFDLPDVKLLGQTKLSASAEEFSANSQLDSSKMVPVVATVSPYRDVAPGLQPPGTTQTQIKSSPTSPKNESSSMNYGLEKSQQNQPAYPISSYMDTVSNGSMGQHTSYPLTTACPYQDYAYAALQQQQQQTGYASQYFIPFGHSYQGYVPPPRMLRTAYQAAAAYQLAAGYQQQQAIPSGGRASSNGSVAPTKERPKDFDFYAELDLGGTGSVSTDGKQRRESSSSAFSSSHGDDDVGNPAEGKQFTLDSADFPGLNSSGDWIEVKSSKKTKPSQNQPQLQQLPAPEPCLAQMQSQKPKKKGKKKSKGGKGGSEQNDADEISNTTYNKPILKKELSVDEKIDNLIEMGFEKKLAIRALQACEKDLPSAVDWLIQYVSNKRDSRKVE